MSINLKLNFKKIPVTTRLYVGIIFLILIPMFAISLYRGEVIYRSLVEVREQQLVSLAKHLAQELTSSYEEILTQKSQGEVTRSERIAILNEELQPIVDKLAQSYPNIGMGYFDLTTLNAVAMEPKFSKDNLFSVPLGHPYLKYLETRDVVILKHPTSFGWEGKPIIVVKNPIIINGEIIGHTWATIKIEDIIAHVEKTRQALFLVTMVFLGIALLSTYYLIRVGKQILKQFAALVISGSMDPISHGGFPELKELAEEVIVARREREKVQEQFRKVFKFNPIAMSIICKENNNYIDVNDSWISLFGKKREELIGKDARGFSFFLKDEKQQAELCDHIKREEIINKELKVFANQDEEREILFTSNMMVLGEKECILIVITDVTELSKLKRKLTRFDTLNLIAQMAAGIGHEIRNPMTTVRGFLQLIKSKDREGVNDKYYDIMIDELDRANHIITEFLSLARDKESKFDKININSILEKIFPLLFVDSISKNVMLELKTKEISELYLNEKEIRQLIYNLVRNAREAMPMGGKITIATDETDEEVLLSVKDDGVGIDSTLLSSVGTPFFTTKDEGTGLGLAICNSIAANHNAVIEIESGTKGTTVKVRFKN